MTRLSTILGALALIGVASSPALAQTANKTWVSSASGNDTGTCQFVAPCKTFAYAITQTAAGGELDVKDSGSYGMVTITKAISIVSVGALAAIAVPSGATGIAVSAGSNDKVVLQGLVIDGHSAGGNNGIAFNSGDSLTVTDCHIRNLVNGIVVQTLTSRLYYISKTEIENASSAGVNASTGSAPVAGMLKEVELLNNRTGISLTGAGGASLINSTVVGNYVGISTDTGNNSSGGVGLGNSVISNNTYAQITATNNHAVYSYEDNYYYNGGAVNIQAESKD